MKIVSTPWAFKISRKASERWYFSRLLSPYDDMGLPTFKPSRSWDPVFLIHGDYDIVGIMGTGYESLEAYILSKKNSRKEFPFGPNAAVFKVYGKMFALIAWTERPVRITLKCNPDDADVWRSLFDAVEPGYHMNKTHWNTVTLDGTVPDGIILDMIDSSYALVARKIKE
jgi:predicted DNA-binding protein (MmcQ/YjbR family)